MYILHISYSASLLGITTLRHFFASLLGITTLRHYFASLLGVDTRCHRTALTLPWRFLSSSYYSTVRVLIQVLGAIGSEARRQIM